MFSKAESILGVVYPTCNMASSDSMNDWWLEPAIDEVKEDDDARRTDSENDGTVARKKKKKRRKLADTIEEVLIIKVPLLPGLLCCYIE